MRFAYRWPRPCLARVVAWTHVLWESHVARQPLLGLLSSTLPNFKAIWAFYHPVSWVQVQVARQMEYSFHHEWFVKCEGKLCNSILSSNVTMTGTDDWACRPVVIVALHVSDDGKSSNEWLNLKMGHQDSSPSNGRQCDLPYQYTVTLIKRCIKYFYFLDYDCNFCSNHH